MNGIEERVKVLEELLDMLARAIKRDPHAAGWNQTVLNVHREEDTRTTVIERTSSTKRNGFRVKVDLADKKEAEELVREAVRLARWADAIYDAPPEPTTTNGGGPG